MTSATIIAPIATGVQSGSFAKHRQCAVLRPARLAGKLQRSNITLPSLSNSSRRLTTIMAAGE